MPHRVIFLWSHFQLMIATTGVATTALASASLAVIDPTHLQLVIIAIGGGFVYLLRSAMKDLVPIYLGVRKQFAQSDIEIAAMRQQVATTEAKADENRQAIDAARAEAAAEIARVKAEAEEAKAAAIEKALQVERKAAKKRHELRDDLQAKLLAAEVKIAELQARRGITDITVDAVIDTVEEIGEHIRPPVSVEIQRLDPDSNRRDAASR